jgi:SOS-response transcriptional repressors (RecA-mediated autopeptidases)
MRTLRTLRENRAVSQQDVADYLGVSRQAYNFYENGKREASFEILLKLSEYFNTTVDYLLRGEPATAVIQIPVYGKIPAGIPMEAIQDILDIEEAPAEWARGGKSFFALQIDGDSMSPNYLDGDVIIFQKQPTCESGQDCCVMVNGSDATFKRLFKNEKGLTLQPLNPAYEVKVYSTDEVKRLPVTVLGVVYELRRKF